jgi:hypothetical protein
LIGQESELEKSMKAQKLWRSSLLIAALIPAGVIAACSAKIGNEGPGFSGASTAGGTNNSAAANGGGGGSSGSVGSSGSPASTAMPATALLPDKQVAESAGILQMRRVTYSEYDNMLHDLLGDTTRPGEDPSHPWSADAQNVNGFASPNSTADQQIQNYFYTTASAVVEAAITAGKLPIPAGCATPAASAETACATTFANTFGAQAYRRPVAAAELADLMTLFTAVRTTYALSFTESLGAMAKAMLQSPNFLYHWEIGPTKPVVGSDGLVPLTPWQLASRLAESLWNTTPDATLLAAAQAGQLSTPAEVLAQAERMIADPRAAQALLDMYGQWVLSVGTRPQNLGGLPPTSTLTQNAIDALPGSFSSFLASVYSGDGTMSTLFTGNTAYVNSDLAKMYGIAAPAGATATALAKVTLTAAQRSGGLFTQIPFLAQFASGVVDNPIFRGLSIYTKVLCGSASPPAVAVPGVNFVAQTTTRASYEKHAMSACAKGCHTLFDPPGFAFENYDGIGQYRTTDNGQPVDSTGTFTSPAGTTFTFTNAADMLTQLAASPETQQCLDRNWARYMFGRLETDADTGSLQAAWSKGGATTGFSMRDMLTAFVSSKAYMYRTLSQGETL